MKKILTLLTTIVLSTTPYALVKEYRDMVQPFIDAFKSNDKNYIAEVFERGGVTTKADFIKHFDEYFDESLSNKIANSTLDDWDMMGWRGIMFDNGLIWLDQDGSFRHSNYETKKAKELRLKAIKKDKSLLHPMMKDFLHNNHQWETQTSLIRIDRLANNKYRFSSWANHDISTIPDLIINNGTFKCDGTACYEIYTFESNNLKLIVGTGGISSESSPKVSIDIYVNDKPISEKYMCDAQRCIDRAKDETSSQLIFEKLYK